MAHELREDTAVLTGIVTVDEAEPLVAWLRTRTRPAVDLRDCTHLHTAVLQALMFFESTLATVPADPFLAHHVVACLNPPTSTSTSE